jgi:hypothetical protein
MTIRPQSVARLASVALRALTRARSDTATAAPAGRTTWAIRDEEAGRGLIQYHPYTSPCEDLRVKQ